MNLFFWKKVFSEPEEKGSRFGLQDVSYKITDYFFNGISGIKSEPLNPSGNWSEYLPESELQVGTYLETLACVSFSALNCLEILMKKKFGITINFSDRLLAKNSGTTHNGNSFTRVGDSIRKDGLVTEMEYPFFRGRPDKIDWDAYYAEIPNELKSQAKKFLEEYKVQYEWVGTDNESLMEALKEAPLQVTITYTTKDPNGDGIIEMVLGKEEHAVTLYGYKENEYWLLFDHYYNFTKKVAWNYKFFHALKYDITKIEVENNMFNKSKFESNTLLQEVEQSGSFYLYVDGKLYEDDYDKLLMTFIMRNNGKIEGRVKAVKVKDIEGLPHFNLKNQPL